jgi:hypothetical protein
MQIGFEQEETERTEFEMGCFSMFKFRRGEPGAELLAEQLGVPGFPGGVSLSFYRQGRQELQENMRRSEASVGGRPSYPPGGMLTF